MITLSKSGNTVVFEFENNGHYLYNGTIEVPINSLSLVTDESEMATFKKSASNDIFISALYSDFGMTKEELISWYKANMVGDGIDPDEIQEMIDESISGKADTSAVTEEISAAVSGYADSVQYNTSSKYVEFYHGGTGGTKVYEFDASPFIIDGMVESVVITSVTSGGSEVTVLEITWNSAAGSQVTDIPLSDIFDPSLYYTKSETSGKTEIANALAEKVNIADNNVEVCSTSTTTSINTTYASGATSANASWIAEPSLGGYMFYSLSVTLENQTGGTQSYSFNQNNPPYGGGEVDDDKVTIEVTSDDWYFYLTIAPKGDYRIVGLSGSKIDDDERTSSISFTVSRCTSMGQSAEVIGNTILPSLANKVDTTTYTAYTAATDVTLSGKQNVLTAGSGITISGDVISADAQEITIDPTLDSGSTNPVANSAVTTTILSNEMVTSAALNDLNTRKAELSAMTFELSLKQDVLSAGTGISISGNVISSTATGEQSDWNEADQNSEAYIKNRPFYGTGGIKNVIYSNDNRTVDIVNGDRITGNDFVDFGINLTVGKHYRIAYMSEYQEVTPQNIGYVSKDNVIIGTVENNNTGSYTNYAYIIGYTEEGAMMGEPFAISNDLKNWCLMNIMTEEYGVYLLIYDYVNDPIVQLDSKYIKDDIARVSAVSGKVDTTTYTAYTAATSTALSGKQDTLIAGSGITISGNVISSTGGGGGGGSVHADWNENNSGSTSYIKNRPFYEGQAGYDSSYTPDTVVGNFRWIFNGTQPFVVGDEIYFQYSNNSDFSTIDYQAGGVIKTVSGMEADCGYYTGDADNIGGVIVHCGEPSMGELKYISIWSSESGGVTRYFYTLNGANDEISQYSYFRIVKRVPGSLKKLDSKFIDSDIARSSRLGGLSLVKLTQSEYNALSPNYDSNTLYIITN